MVFSLVIHSGMCDFCASHCAGQILDYVYTICSYGQISISCIIPHESPSPPSRALSYTLCEPINCIR